MTEEEFSKRLAQREKDRLKQGSDALAACAAEGSYSFMRYWATLVIEVLNGARERMAREDALNR